MKYSCDTASETLEWIKAIVEFLHPYRFFFDSHVVNFFKDGLWEAVDRDWIDCLRNEPVEHLLQIPSGVVQDHWPVSLKEFILSANLLAFQREQANLERISPDMCVTSLNTVLAQGMKPKKKHEVEVLAAVVDSIARRVQANAIVDVGAGQGYLAQVLCFQYQHSVVAIDASSHHGIVTYARAERIKRHYLAKQRKSGLGKGSLKLPKTLTCRVLSSSTLRNLSYQCCQNDECEELEPHNKCFNDNYTKGPETGELQLSCNGVNANSESFLLLAGLHACGDLSVTMLRAFIECKQVKAVLGIGCCYNLLSQEGHEDGADCGFPMSKGVNCIGLSLGKNACDLACQSAERWRALEKDAGLQNFDLHAFRAAFQMVLDRYYPELVSTSPSIGRQGKALRRQQKREMLSAPDLGENKENTSKLETHSFSYGISCDLNEGGLRSIDKYDLFVKFSLNGMRHLGVEPLPDMDLRGLWKDCQPFANLIGPYWSLRAALGPVLETLLLLDRLLFLQEYGNLLEVIMSPIFDPALSPRNVAIIAWKN